MIRRSLFTRLTLFFLFILAAVLTGFYFLYQEVRIQQRTALETESKTVLELLRRTIHLPEEDRKRHFESQHYGYAKADFRMLQTLKPLFDTPPERFAPEIRSSMEEGRIRILGTPSLFYILINRPDAPFMIAIAQPSNSLFWLWGALTVLLLLLGSFYISVIRSLIPLKELTRAIKQYGEDGTYTPTQSSANDEIAYVGNAFDEAVRKNRSLTEARRLFMRNVMHELKTPITVGKLAIPFLSASKETEMLERAFTRMEHLIDEMARVEQVTSRSAAMQLQSCSLSKLTDDAAALLLADGGTVVREFRTNDAIAADCGMMTTVFKNLIDNAFKYGSDRRVVIRREADRLLFINRGEPWPEDQCFEMLLAPFVHTRNSAAAKSFGLGLYIVHSILEAQKMGFGYYYENGEHCFIIESLPFADADDEAG